MYYKRLKDLREDHDFTQKVIAQILNTSRQQYGKYERGERDIPADFLSKLAKLYNTSIDFIVGDTNNPKRYSENSK